MRIQHQHFIRSRVAARRDERGLATMIFIVLLAIMMILVTAEARALYNLHREVKLLEKQQIKRLNASITSLVSATNSLTK